MGYDDDRLIFLLGQARHRLYARLDRSLLDVAGITTPQAGALFYLMDHNGCLLMELSRGLMLDKSAITRMAVRLEQRGLIERRPCKIDGRSTRVFITREAEKAVSRCRPVLRHFNAAAATGFRPSQIRMFRRFLKHIISDFSE